MSTTIIGASTGNITSQTVTLGENGNGRIVYEMPVASSVSPPATLEGLRRRSISTQTQGGKKTVTAIYSEQPINVQNRPSPDKTVIRSTDATAQELPIRQHPLCSNKEELDEPPIIGGQAKPGVESYLVPGAIYRRSEWFASATFANMATNLGKRNDPTGGPSIGGGWLKTGIQIDENADGSMIRTETWLWSPTGWDTDIYEAS